MSPRVQVEGRELALSNLDKPMYPQAGLSKGDVISYYTRIAPQLLPHLTGRALTLKRYPDGVEGPYFYEKRCPSHRPVWVATAGVPSGRHGRVEHCVVDGLPALVWVANLASLELHVPLARSGEPHVPTAVVFDLDPGPPADVLACAEVGLMLRDLLAHAGLRGFVKTSGSKGLQVYVPLNDPDARFEQTSAFARAVAEALAGARPDLVVSRMTKSLRAGRVLIDWSQNAPSKTTVCAYSLRALERPTVSAPLRWEEVEGALRAGDAAALRIEADAALERAEALGDLFAPVEELRQPLPALP